MTYFSSQELAAVKNDLASSKAKSKKPKQTGRGGFITSLLSEAGGAGGALGGAALGSALLPGVGTVIGAGLGGLLGGTGGRIAENEVRDNRVGLGDALKEGAVSGIAGAGPIRLAKAGAGAIKGAKQATGAIGGANDALSKSFLGKLTGKPGDKVGQRLTETGSGLKADPNVGGIARLEDNASFMSKYTGTPRKQRVSMEKDMRDLSTQVDDVLGKTPIQVDGSQIGQRLKSAAQDLTDERYLDLDLNNPSVSKIIDRYSDKFSAASDAKGINDIVKTLNKTATRAQNKLVDEKAGVLTAQEQAALALKRAGDDVLRDIPEIAPLKKQMAQIFEVTPQVAKQSERGISAPLAVGGIKFKAPIQGANSLASRAGARLQGVDPGNTTGGILGKVLGTNAITSVPGQQPVLEDTAATDSIDTSGQQAVATTPEDILAAEAGSTDDTDPYSTANVQATVKSILAQGGTQKDVAEYLANAKTISDLTATSGSGKPLSAEASKVVSNAQTGIQALDDFEGALQSDPSLAAKRVIPGRGLFGGLLGGALGTSSADAAANQIVDVIARLRTGAAITKDEAARFEKFIPQAGDPPATRQQKINYLKNQFEMVANRSGGSGTDLEAALSI